MSTRTIQKVYHEALPSGNTLACNEEGNLENPQDWKAWLKWSIIVLVSFIELLTHITSLMFAPGIAQVQHDFHIDNGALATLTMTVYVLGFGVGPLLFSPLSEVYGRAIVYRVCICVFLIFTIACALATNLNMLIAFRFLAGCFGSAPVAIGAAIVSDLFKVKVRGRAMAIYQLGPIMGNLLGPPIGGIIIQRKGWRWVFWVMSIMAGFAAVCTTFILRETHTPTVLRRRARDPQAALRPDLALIADEMIHPSTTSTIARAIQRPFKLLFLSPIVLCTCIVIAILMGTMNLIFATLGLLYQQQYRFPPSSAGLVYLEMTLGFIAGAYIFGRTSDRILVYLTTRGDGQTQPEFRLPAMIIGSPLVVCGLFWYGWTIEAHRFWLIPILGLTLVGLGTTAIQLSISTYLVDAYTEFAASASAAITVARSLGGALIPLAGQPLYDRLGLGWGNSLLAFLNLAVAVIPIMLFVYGAKLRAKHTIQNL